MSRFSLRFPEDIISFWYAEYGNAAKPEDARIEEEIENKIIHRVRESGYLAKPDFLTICRWKTRRSQRRCASNDEEFVKAVSQVALSTSSEQLRIEIWTLLRGVEWPTASTLLHWLHPEPYPILDFRALWSLGYKKPPKYDFEFWRDYTFYCRRLAEKNNVSVRFLDRALWQYSSKNQR